MHQAQKERCPDLDPKLWDQITAGPERCLVELTFKNGFKTECHFFDGWCPEGFDFANVVAVKIIGGL